MRKSAAALIAGGCMVVWAARGSAKTETLTGQVIDLACYARNKANTGMDHGRDLDCARACVKREGQPAGLLTTGGKVYQFAGGLAANNNAKIAPHLSHTVTVTGDVTERDGMPMLSASDVKMIR
jgi:hypothetical protein